MLPCLLHRTWRLHLALAGCGGVVGPRPSTALDVDANSKFRSAESVGPDPVNLPRAVQLLGRDYRALGKGRYRVLDGTRYRLGSPAAKKVVNVLVTLVESLFVELAC